jgi:hypothetical protein
MQRRLTRHAWLLSQNFGVSRELVNLRCKCCAAVDVSQRPPAAGDALADFLASLSKVQQLNGTLLALPGHQRPFEQPRQRISALLHHHERRLDEIEHVIADGAKGSMGRHHCRQLVMSVRVTPAACAAAGFGRDAFAPEPFAAGGQSPFQCIRATAVAAEERLHGARRFLTLAQLHSTQVSTDSPVLRPAALSRTTRQSDPLVRLHQGGA